VLSHHMNDSAWPSDS